MRPILVCASLSSDALLTFLDEIVPHVSLYSQSKEEFNFSVCVCKVTLGAMPPHAATQSRSAAGREQGETKAAAPAYDG